MRDARADLSQANFRELEASAQGARLALACAFSGSDEFEAELIRERRAAGAYATPLHRHPVVWALVFILALGLIAAFR